jgi:hypothetical protein
MSVYSTPRERAKARCRSRIDGKHEWLYVGGTLARCSACGAERSYDPTAKRFTT